MLSLGGDHYVTYPLLVAHAEKFGKPLSLIHFDAHCDTWPDDGHPDQLNHGTMFYKAVNEGMLHQMPSKHDQVLSTQNDLSKSVLELSTTTSWASIFWMPSGCMPTALTLSSSGLKRS